MSSALDKAYHSIRDAILSGEYLGGAPLREEELAAAIGVSRTPVREALRRLAAQGLVEVIPNHGARVVSLTGREFEEIFDIRLLLEGYAARKAAERIDEATLDTLERIVAEMGDAGTLSEEENLSRLAELNNRFHALISAATRSTRLATLIDNVIVASLVLRTFQSYSPAELEQSLAHHRELLRALRARDPRWAESVIHTHIRAAWNAVRTTLPAE